MASERKGSIELFKVAGVQVEIDYSWIFIAVLIWWSLSAGYFPRTYPGHAWSSYWIVGAVGTALFFASILGHELSHAALGNRLGENVTRITLFIFGGVAHLTSEPKTAGDEFKIAAIGPLSSVVIAAIFWTIEQTLVGVHAPELWIAMFSYLAFINVALAVFNLLPGFPLDGGRILRAILWHHWGDFRRATAAAADWGNTIAWGMIVLGGLEIFGGELVSGIWMIFIGLFLRGAAHASYQSVVIEQILGRPKVADLMIREPVSIDPDATISDAVDHYFLHYGYTGFPVVKDGRAMGILSLSRVRECPREERGNRHVHDIMVPITAKVTISPSASISDAMHQMAEADAGRLLVLDGERLSGLITRSQIARFVQLKAQLDPTPVPSSNSAPDPASMNP
jgi:Zn-dependent protease/predicted transcriptional regulator